MKKRVLSVAAGVLALGMLACGVGFMLKGKEITQKDFLHVENGNLVTEDGEAVLLQGVNLGGWLLQECWMCPVNGEDRKWANLDTIEVLESRFSGILEEMYGRLTFRMIPMK